MITLGIIGVVAALTLPMLSAEYQKIAVESRLKKFYSAYNQAIKLAEAEYGDKESWYDDSNFVQLDDQGNPIEGTSSIDKWFNKYLSNFITIEKKIYATGQVRYYLSDGSSFQFGSPFAVVKTTRGVFFFPGDQKNCEPKDENIGKCIFYFLYDPKGLYAPRQKGLGLEPTRFDWDGTRSQLINRCRSDNKAYCTTLIQFDGWKIKNDYPQKVHL